MSNNLRIIVIDDNPAIHQDFIKILTANKEENKADTHIIAMEREIFGEPEKEEGLPEFEIETASQGKEGVQKIKKALEEGRPYSLAFVDIRMPPGWDGIETIKHIWELDQTVQVVICTAYSDYTWEETIEQLGQRDNLLILKKPFDNIAVRQLACALTKKWQLAKEAKQYTSELEEKVHERTEKLKYQATHDLLTDLPNRVLLLEEIKNAIERSKKNNKLFSVLFFDLDRFKLINDSLSHEAGDEVLCAVAKRLKSAIREDDMVARLGGDEFVIIMKDIRNEEDFIKLIDKLLVVFDKPFRIKNHDIKLTTSIGVAVYPKDGKNFELLLRNADTAMYRAKELGANQFQFYTDELNKRNLERLEKEAELRRALSNEEFFLYYQPQFDLKSETLVSVEALIRWQHPTKGVIYPMDFIPLAEESGLIVPIGEWVLRTACKQNKKWQDAGFIPIRVAVNVTTKQFRLYNLVDIVAKILNETGLEAKYLELELTENTIVNNIDIINTIHDLKKMGIQIVLDDFGTGYSSLNYLRELPVDRLKIDQSYVQNIDTNRGDDFIIQAIIAMAHSLNLEVLAEGVESEKQLEFLKKHKCSEVQGFYFSKPIPPELCEELLKDPHNLKLAEEIEGKIED